MEVITGKYPAVKDFPFVQMIGMAADAAQARNDYHALAKRLDVEGYILTDGDDVAGLALFSDDDGDVTLLAALAWRNQDPLALIDKLLVTFSKNRVKSLTVTTFAGMDVAHLLSHGFKPEGHQRYRKDFEYPVAIIFGGGGAHGAFLTGAWEVLFAHGIQAQRMYGVSVGAITGMSLMHNDPTSSKETWAQLTTDMVYEVDEVGLSKAQFRHNLTHNLIRQQFFKKDSLRQVIKPVVEKELATPRIVDFTLLATEFPVLRQATYAVTDDTTVDQLVDWILASSAFYPFVAPVIIDGKKYIDGGYTNNVPVDVASADGFKEIYAMSIMDGVPAGQKVAEDVIVHEIRSPWELGPLLDFIPAESARHLKLGELRTRQVLGELFGYYYSFAEEPDFDAFGGANLITTLAGDRVTAGIAKLLRQAPVWFAWAQWVTGHAEQPEDHSIKATGVAALERLGEMLSVDGTEVYDQQSFIRAIIAAAKQDRSVLPTPHGPVTTAYVIANPAVVLTAIVYLLSQGLKTGKITG
jgi:predicted acylesterase/phospholipase RssA